MANTLRLEIIVDDKGTPIVQKFADGTTAALGKVEGASGQMGGGFEKTWAGIATGANQAVNLFRQVAGAVNTMWSMAESAAGYLEQMQLLDGLARASGTTAKALTDSIRGVGEGMISMATAASSAMSGLAKHLTPDQMIKLAKAAVTLSDVMGMTADQAFKNLSTAMESGKEKTLKLAVGVIDLKERYGEAAEKMTDAEKRTALYNIVIEKAAEMQKRMGDQSKSTADKMDMMHVTVQDLNLQLGTVFLRVAAGVIGMWNSISAASLKASFAYWKVIEATNKAQALISFGEVSKTFSEAASIAAQNAASDWAESIRLGDKAGQSFDTMMASTEELIKATGKQGLAISNVKNKTGEELAAAKKAAQEKEQAIKSITEAIRKSAYEAETIGQNQYEKDVARIKSDAEKYTAAMGEKEISAENLLKVQQYVAVEMEGANKKAYEEMAKDARKASDDAISEMERQIAQGVKLTEEHIKGAEEYKQLVADAAEFAATENERAINKIIGDEQIKFDKIEMLYDKGFISFSQYVDLMTRYAEIGNAAILEKETENAMKIAKLNSDMITGIRGWEAEAYNARIKEIDAEAAKKLKDLGGDKASAEERVRLAAWTADQQALAYIAMGKSGNDFFAGVTAGFLEMERNTMTFGKAGYDIFNTFATASSTALSTILFDSIKTGTFDAQKVWESFADAMLKKLTDIIAQMIVQWGLYQAAVLAANLISAAAPGSAASTIAGNLAASLAPQGAGVGTLTTAAGLGKLGYSALAGGTTAAGAATLGGAGMAMAPSGFVSGGAGMAMAPSGFGAAAAAASAPLWVAGAAVLAPLAAMFFGGAFDDNEYVSRANQYTPDVWAGLWFRKAQMEDIGRGISGGDWYEPIKPAELRDEWKRSYDRWYYEMATYFGQSIPQSISANEAWLSSAYYKGGGYPAKMGLDYIPRDNFLIRGHEGEAVLTKPQAEEWRGGSRGGITIQGPLVVIEGNLIGNEDSFNELVEKIEYRLSKLAKWEY